MMLKTGAEAPIRILIVDDDGVYREIVRGAVGGDGVEAVTASDGVEALRKLETGPFDILVTDLNMPKMDGLTLIRRVGERLPHILSIVVTGYASLESAVEAVRLGAYDYVQKPFKTQEIMVTVRNAVEKVRCLRERNRLLFEMERLKEELDRRNAAEVCSRARERSLPLYLLETPPVEEEEGISRALSNLETLKELRREGVVGEVEFSRLKKIIIDKMESGRT